MTEQIPADEAAFLAVGVPEEHREAFVKRAITVLGQYGFRAMEMEPDDVVAQGAHILKVRQLAEQANKETDSER